MKIRYDTRPPGSRGGSGAGSLLARLDKGSSGSLASRISDKGNGTEQPSGTKECAPIIYDRSAIAYYSM